MTYIPSLVIVGQYFTKARSRALGIATSGSGIGVFIIPLMLEVIFDYYGYQGGMVLLGGLLFNTIVSGALYRPLTKLSIDEEVEMTTKFESENVTKGVIKRDGDQQDNEKDDTSQEEDEPRSEPRSDSKGEMNYPLWYTRISGKLGLYLLCDRAFLSYFITIGLSTACCWSAQMLLPALATSREHSTSHAVLLLSLLGVFDVIGRLAGGVLFDVPCVRTRRLLMYCVFVVLTFLSELAWPVTASSYPLLAIMVALHGLAGGVIICQKTVVVADLVGIEQLARGLGLVVFSQGIGVMTVPLIAGRLCKLNLHICNK